MTRIGKFQSGLIKQVREDIAFQEEQEKLKEKHHIEDENKIVVEKSNMAKFTVKTLIALIKTIAMILLLLLAAVGLTSLLYPPARQAIFQFLNITKDQLIDFIS